MSDDVKIKVGIHGTNTSVKDLKKTQKSVKNLGDETDELSSKAEKAKSLWKKFAVGVSAVGVAAVAATKKFANFEKSMQGIVTIIGDRSIKNVERLKNGILDLGAKGFGSFENINQAIYDFISATGSSVPEALKFMRDASDAAAIGITDISTTTDIATTAIEVYGKEVDNIQDVFKSYYVAVREGKTTFDEIAASQGRVAATSKALGVQMEEELAVFAAATKAGVAQSEVVSALKAAYSNILKPTKEAQEAATDLGLKFDAQALKTKKLIPFLTELAQKTEGNAQAQSALFGSMEAFTVISALTANNAEELNRIFAAMGDEAQVAEDYIDGVKRTTENTDRAFKIITNTFNKWVTLIGEEFSPAIKLVADAMQALDEAFTGNKVNIQELVKEQKEAIIIRDSLQKKLDEEQEKLDNNSGWWSWYTEKLVASLQRQIEEKQLQVDTLAEQIAQEQKLLAEQDEANKERKLEKLEWDAETDQLEKDIFENQLQTHVENEQSIEDKARALKEKAYNKELQTRLKLDDTHYKTLITEQQKYDALKNKLIVEDAAQEAKRKLKEREQFLKDEIKHGTAIAKFNALQRSKEFQAASFAANSLSQLQMSGSKTMQKIGKAAARANIIVNTAHAISKGYAQLGPYGGTAFAALMVAMGREQILNVGNANIGMSSADAQINTTPQIDNTQSATINDPFKARADALKKQELQLDRDALALDKAELAGHSEESLSAMRDKLDARENELRIAKRELQLEKDAEAYNMGNTQVSPDIYGSINALNQAAQQVSVSENAIGRYVQRGDEVIDTEAEPQEVNVTLELADDASRLLQEQMQSEAREND